MKKFLLSLSAVVVLAVGFFSFKSYAFQNFRIDHMTDEIKRAPCEEDNCDDNKGGDCYYSCEKANYHIEDASNKR